MTNRLSLTMLCREGALAPGAIAGLFERLRAAGFEVIDADGDVRATTADGMESISFPSTEASIAWLDGGEGLLTVAASNVDIDLSVRRRAGALASTPIGVPDEMLFDVVDLSPTVSRLDAAAWVEVEAAWHVALTNLDMAFAYVLDEELTEVLWPHLCVHRRLASGRLPPFVPWLMAAPAGSSLAPELEHVASVLGLSARSRDGLVSLTLGHLWDRDSAPTVVDASERWRNVTGDPGCDPPDATAR